MLKKLLMATTALALMSGIGFAETTYSDSISKTTPGGVDISKSTTRSSDATGTTIQKNKTISKDFDRDHDNAMVRKDFDRDHDNAMTRKDFDHDHDRAMNHDFDHDRDHDAMATKDKTVTKDTHISSNGDVSKKKSETTTIR